MMKPHLTQLTEHVWLLPHHPDPNTVRSSVGVIATRNRSLLVDAGNGPRVARQLKTELVRYNLPPVSRIIYTHHHWDHIYGACEFGVPVTAHTICKAILEAEARKPWGIEFLEREIKRNPKLEASYTARAKSIEDWAAFQIIVPEEVFEEKATIDLDGLTIELEHVGGVHAEDSLVVKVPQEGVMFLGDCYYPPPLHLREGDPMPSFEMLRKLQDPAYQVYVEGHDKPFAHSELLNLLRQIDEQR